MQIYELILIAVGLSMDAFAVSICKGLASRKVILKQMILCGLWFGGFQALMPTIGYFLGGTFRNVIASIDHWIAFGMLLYIGYNMIKEAHESEEISADFSIKAMFPLAVATSIDALITGVMFAFIQVSLLKSVGLIGIFTFLFCFFGVKIGEKTGEKFGKQAQEVGGMILIFIGIKILVTHLGLI